MGNVVGFRFQPKDEEIIALLNKKRLDSDFSVQTINEVDIYNFEPLELPRLAAIQSDELVWYFLCQPYYKFTKSGRANRRTKTGTWKSTGKGCKIFAKNSNHVIGHKKFLVFREDSNASKKHKTEWVMHEFRCDYNPLHKTDFVICRIERKHNNKTKISTSDDGQSSHHLASKFSNYFEENNLSMVEFQQLSSDDHMTCNLRNHVAENTYSRVQPQQLASHMPFDSRNHVAENNVQREDLQLLRNHVAENISLGIEYQLLSQCSTSDDINHVAENSLAREEPQLLTNHVAENTFPWVESQQLPSHHLISDYRDQDTEQVFSGVEPLQKFDAHSGYNQLDYNSFSTLQSPINIEYGALSGCDWLDQNSFFALQSLINPQQGSSSYSDGFSIDCNLWNFQFDGEQEDVNSQWCVLDKYPFEETGHASPPRFNSSKLVTEVAFW